MTDHHYFLWRKPEAARDESIWMKSIGNFPATETALKSNDTVESLQNRSALQDFRGSVLKCCTSGFGFVLLRGFPVDPSDEDTTKNRFERFAKSIGVTLSQDSQGEHLGELSARNRGPDWYNELPLHTDGANLLLLLSVRSALSGGLTKLACAAAILETMQIEHPTTWQMLFEPWAFHRGKRPGPAYFERPIFKEHFNSTPDCFFLPGTIRKTPDVAGIPLSPERLEVLAHFQEIAEREDHQFRLKLSPGDVLVVNNNKVLHARTQYADAPNGPQRLLLRMWVNVHEEEFR
ncbi:MAG: TauD/TfdA family dioxygenase [Afipia sp.]|nr:TauD/TfdA family dioxygenase [Afipia sp.]